MAFTVGVLVYALAMGWCYGAFAALVLATIGRNGAVTKYALLAALANFGPSGMTIVNGWVHDRWGSPAMLQAEALGVFATIAVALPMLGLVRRRS